MLVQILHNTHQQVCFWHQKRTVAPLSRNALRATKIEVNGVAQTFNVFGSGQQYVWIVATKLNQQWTINGLGSTTARQISQDFCPVFLVLRH